MPLLASLFGIGPHEFIFLMFIAGMLAVPVVLLGAILFVLMIRLNRDRQRDQNSSSQE